ncbi:LysR family transcriptional regulator [Aureimonas endophytica]|uniref:LysR family transcriptional regulator n=1 Tax=Aureimonas endophytica TaxID=2027858 RepID=A0A917E9W0_9HYPH|nr:hydrogen peroxide-inducible genes activator [Aureimonas endophytica]GGE14954.1 LysR family transcriptional regulator [Aureimonas endophytica]
MITVRQLRYFQALAEVLHFGKAARLLNVSQPALSAQIAAFEEAVGAKLFERRPTGVAPTPEAGAILEKVNGILAEIRDLEALGAKPDEALGGRLRLGLIATVAPYLLPALLSRVALDHPRLDLALRESLTDALLADVVAGELDCAVVALPVAEPSLETIGLGEDAFWLAVPAREAPRFRGSVEVGDLGAERLILLEEGHCLREQALKVCQLVPTSRFADLSATSLATILRMVAGGLGATLVPEIAVETERQGGGIEILPFRAPAPSRTLALAFRRSTPRRRGFEALAEIILACLGRPRPY